MDKKFVCPRCKSLLFSNEGICPNCKCDLLEARRERAELMGWDEEEMDLEEFEELFVK